MIGTDAPPSTFVPADDDIFGPAGYGASWFALGLVAMILGLALLVWCFHRRPVERVRKRRPADVPALKALYMSRIDELEREFVAHQFDERELHHRLSRTVREFAADLGEPGAVAMTASVLEEVGLTKVATVVAGYERPQFKQWHRSDPPTSCERAKAVIEQW